MPTLALSAKFTFAASHFLTKYQGKCENLHGHNYKLIVTIEGEKQANDMVMDFKIIKKIVEEKIIDTLDHAHLNDILENPSAESIILWIWEHLKTELPLKKLKLYETDDYSCEYEGK